LKENFELNRAWAKQGFLFWYFLLCPGSSKKKVHRSSGPVKQLQFSAPQVKLHFTKSNNSKAFEKIQGW